MIHVSPHPFFILHFKLLAWTWPNGAVFISVALFIVVMIKWGTIQALAE